MAEMMDSILQFDASLFHLINQQWTNELFNYLMPIIRNQYTWLPVYVFLISFIIFNYNWKAIYILLAIAFTFLLTDTVSSKLIKPSIERLRPCKTYSTQAEIRVHCGSGYSFTSSHAANHFGLSFCLIWLLGIRRKWIVSLLVTWASLVSFAQVYVGVHYPLDIAGGALLGIFCAFLVYKIFRISGLYKY